MTGAAAATFTLCKTNLHYCISLPTIRFRVRIPSPTKPSQLEESLHILSSHDRTQNALFIRINFSVNTLFLPVAFIDDVLWRKKRVSDRITALD